MTLDNLTQLQKIAIEGEVAQALSSARHNPEILYRLYIILQNAPKEISEYVVSIVKDLTDIPETDLNRVRLELSAKEFPLWLWIKRTVADIKMSLILALAETLISDASIDKKTTQQKIIKSAFICFCRSVAMMSPKAAKELCQHVLDEECTELDYLSDACFSLLAEVNELTDNGEIPDMLLHKAFDIRNMLSYKIETEVIEALSKRDDRANSGVEADKENGKKVDLNEIVDKVMTRVLNNGLSKPRATKDTTEYAVVKKYEGNNITSVLRTFKTEEEAEAFKGKIEKDYPELTKTCSLNIIRIK